MVSEKTFIGGIKISALRRPLSPHPGPLPSGEGESFPVVEKFKTLDSREGLTKNFARRVLDCGGKAAAATPLSHAQSFI